MKIYISKTLGINDYDGFHLIQDHIGTNHINPWDDFGYIVTFNLYHVSDECKTKIESLKLLINGETDTAKYLFDKGLDVTGKITDVTAIIGSLQAVSLGASKSYYQKIRAVLENNKKDITNLLEMLHDASYLFGERESYESYEGFSATIFRDGETANSLIMKGYNVAIGTYERKEAFSLILDPPAASIDPIEFKFDVSKRIAKTNISLLIGENGTGKSHILKRLSEVMLGITSNKNAWPFFHKLIVAAYSPFESFYTKEQILDLLDTKKNKKKNKNNRKNKEYKAQRSSQINKYAYIGFKNDNNEFSLTWPRVFSVNALKSIMKYDKEENWWTDNTRLKILKSTLSLSMEFDDIAVKLKSNNKFQLVEDDSYKEFDKYKEDIDEQEGLFFLKNGHPIPLSSGQEIFSYMIPSLVSEIEDESLIIIDEPELYLHPTLEVGLINMLKRLLGETNSSAIIATHSAIIAREVAKDGILILKKNDGYTSVSTPEIQTYGESLEVIIGEAFDDFDTIKPFQHEIDALISNETKLNKVISSISKDVGDEALVYINSSSFCNNEIEFERNK